MTIEKKLSLLELQVCDKEIKNSELFLSPTIST